jgi:hypothetical protein
MGNGQEPLPCFLADPFDSLANFVDGGTTLYAGFEAVG